jgi:general secretion pathway protein D
VRFLLTTNQLEMKVLNDSTILVYPNLPNKVKDYQELTVKSFYLANADVKQTLNLIKTVVKTRDVFVDERLNMLTMRDTPEAIRLAERLITAQDLVDPEVVLEVEVLEINRNKLINLGIDFPNRLSFGALGAAGAGQFTLAEWLNRNAGMVNIKITDPALALNLLHQDTDNNILANPTIRVRNREKAKILIGNKVPVITTTATANVGISESVTYLDVGLKLNVEPNVYLNDEVAMKVALEVSSITNTIKDQNGTTTYTLGTRNAETVLRLRSGETEVLAGLIQDQEQITASKVPGLGDLPMVGRLFGNRQNQHDKTEIVLLITPYVVRNIDRPDASALEFPSGTDSTIGGSALGLRSADLPAALAPPAPPVAPAAAPVLPARPEDAPVAVPLPANDGR